MKTSPSMSVYLYRHQREEHENDLIRHHLNSQQEHFDYCTLVGLPPLVDTDPYGEAVTFDGYTTVLWVHGLN